jgi:hypothetical protein
MAAKIRITAAALATLILVLDCAEIGVAEAPVSQEAVLGITLGHDQSTRRNRSSCDVRCTIKQLGGVMIKETTVRRAVCDVCKTEDADYKCLGCGKDFCFRCKDLAAVTYGRYVGLGSRDDGVYCNKCDLEKLEAGTDKVYFAYRAVQALREEAEALTDSLRERTLRAQHALGDLLGD